MAGKVAEDKNFPCFRGLIFLFLCLHTSQTDKNHLEIA